jgi:antitoxin component HigA of HigAB toxin-antitoxin module
MKSIDSKSTYDRALVRIEELIAKNPEEGTILFEELNVLGDLISVYEDVHFPIDIM